jgi:pimeloyl-ACP methyl ester carboxylesterase
MSIVDRGDAQIWWQAEGSGPPVLLIMGLGSPSDMWYRLLPLLTVRSGRPGRDITPETSLDLLIT